MHGGVEQLPDMLDKPDGVVGVHPVREEDGVDLPHRIATQLRARISDANERRTSDAVVQDGYPVCMKVVGDRDPQLWFQPSSVRHERTRREKKKKITRKCCALLL